jgi:glycosyltransferase involved in cell wall biosynthesis
MAKEHIQLPSKPVVSILTPSFNQGRFLPDCLRSVHEQTYPNVEHIVMDGGSTDGSVEILKGAGNSITWSSRRDNGQSDALNRAFQQCTGSIIGWLNSDDAYYRPTVIADIVQAFGQHPEVDVFYGHCALVNADGLLLHLMWAPPFSATLLKAQNFINQPTAFIRRSALGSTFVDESFDYAMDRELWLRLGRSSKFARLPRVLAIDRHHRGRKGETMHEVASSDAYRLRERYGAVANDAGPIFKLWRIATRTWGLTLIPGARRGPFAFSALSDGALPLVVRQIATPRRWMPVGN